MHSTIVSNGQQEAFTAAQHHQLSRSQRSLRPSRAPKTRENAVPSPSGPIFGYSISALTSTTKTSSKTNRSAKPSLDKGEPNHINKIAGGLARAPFTSIQDGYRLIPTIRNKNGRKSKKLIEKLPVPNEPSAAQSLALTWRNDVANDAAKPTLRLEVVNEGEWLLHNKKDTIPSLQTQPSAITAEDIQRYRQATTSTISSSSISTPSPSTSSSSSTDITSSSSAYAECESAWLNARSKDGVMRASLSAQLRRPAITPEAIQRYLQGGVTPSSPVNAHPKAAEPAVSSSSEGSEAAWLAPTKKKAKACQSLDSLAVSTMKAVEAYRAGTICIPRPLLFDMPAMQVVAVHTSQIITAPLLPEPCSAVIESYERAATGSFVVVGGGRVQRDAGWSRTAPVVAPIEEVAEIETETVLAIAGCPSSSSSSFDPPVQSDAESQITGELGRAHHFGGSFCGTGLSGTTAVASEEPKGTGKDRDRITVADLGGKKFRFGAIMRRTVKLVRSIRQGLVRA